MNKFYVIFLFFISITLNVFAAPVYWADNGHYYDFVPTSTTWHTARSQSEGLTYLGMNGYLATVTSANENAFLNTQYNNGQSSRFAWIGGYQYDKLAEPAGHWRWVTDELWSYTNWGGIEPNNNNTALEDYAMFNIGALFAGTQGIQSGQWGDAIPTPHSGDPVVGYFVEYGPSSVVPEPTSMILFGLGGLAFSFIRRKK
jgi:hypothetical protein